jgi:eukaryotic-like serine/threonine-protein kinase
MTEVRAGEVIAGKFQIERVLGEGGMGYVVAARHLQLGQMVALKFMRDDVMTDEYKSRFLREARNTVRLKSKHVSRVLDVGSLDGGAPYMVMEYLEGTDLSALLQKRGPFPAAEACEYILQACEAIAEAHGHGIVHRDLKPANLFLTRGSGGEAVIKVLDFGVSKVLELGSDETSPGGRRGHLDSVVTKATDLLGSPSYMSPEQVVSARDADARSDVWSLGIILYRLISGKAPFTGNSLGDLIQNIVHGPMPNLRDLRPDLPEGLEHVLFRCLDRDKTRRPDVVELARMLAPYAGPNAAPSLERIAILGPALVSVPPPVSHKSRPTFGGSGNSGNAAWSAPPPALSNRTNDPARRDMSAASFLTWASLLGIVLASMVLIGMRYGKIHFGKAPAQTPPVESAAPVASVSAPPPQPTQTPEPPPTQTPVPAAEPTPKTTGHSRVPAAGHTKPKPTTTATKPTSDIPPTRE